MSLEFHPGQSILLVKHLSSTAFVAARTGGIASRVESARTRFNIHDNQQAFGPWTLRFGKWPPTYAFTDRITEVLGLHYQMACPPRVSDRRDARRTPIHEAPPSRRLLWFQERLERLNWYGAPKSLQQCPTSRTNRRIDAKEHLAARQQVALLINPVLLMRCSG